MGFPRQEYWSVWPFPPLGDLPDLGIEPTSPMCPALQADSLLLEPPVSPDNGILWLFHPERVWLS